MADAAYFFDLESPEALFRLLTQVEKRFGERKNKRVEELLLLVFGFTHLREWIAPGYFPENVPQTPEERFYREIFEVPEFSLTGNLLENAFTWASTRVSLEAARGEDELVITVNDDGPGMTPPECEAALVRGTRLDETTPGDRLGLAILRDLISEYGGELTLERSTLAGLEATLRLPGPWIAKPV